MKTFEEYKAKESKIVSSRSGFQAFIHTELEGTYETMYEAQDIIEDILMEELRADHKYICDFCNLFCDEKDVEHRIEDRTFTAPYGSTITIGGDVSSVPVCPNGCDNDLEETK